MWQEGGRGAAKEHRGQGPHDIVLYLLPAKPHPCPPPCALCRTPARVDMATATTTALRDPTGSPLSPAFALEGCPPRRLDPGGSKPSRHPCLRRHDPHGARGAAGGGCCPCTNPSSPGRLQRLQRSAHACVGHPRALHVQHGCLSHRREHLVAGVHHGICPAGQRRARLPRRGRRYCRRWCRYWRLWWWCCWRCIAG